MRKIIVFAIIAVISSSCSIYRKYQRPENLPTDSLYRAELIANPEDTASLGSMPWEELFTDPYLRDLIDSGLVHNTDLQTAILRVEQAQAGLYSAKWAYSPSLNLSPQGSGILTAAFVLAIMIVPYAASLSSEFIKMVPADLKEAAYGLGATRAEVIRRVIFPTAGSGIFSAYILAIGRALGETMTVTMLIGNTNQMPETLRTTGNTMASIIANQFGEADGLKLSSLIAIGLILFLITAIINLIGKIMIRRAQHV